ncbi:DUF6482 family protein [Planctobacterium marinum]|uniref:DUF6482 family protein n=1 Tax=Planctobacterium marinum TaxID=1631968 RepID=UPI001E38D731|nr:DUF6482 family protein [Planctobacterium marinum]MCC2605212.1 DUF6482 family protein [Planctobacterium marinum]
MNLHIESFEGGFYLAAIEDNNRTWYLYDEQNHPKKFNCINEIKSFLDNERFEKVWLKQNTPYDEMCGMTSTTEDMKLELEWH